MAALQDDADLSQYLLPIVVRQDVKVSYSAASRKSIWEYDARSRAAEDYSRLVEIFHSEKSYEQAKQASPALQA